MGMGQPGMGSDGAAMLARGGSVLAASLLFLLGVFHIFSGIAAFARDNFYNVGSTYPYQTSNTAWGWIHLAGGILLVITGLALFGRAPWARWVAIVVAVVSAVINFFFLPYFPLWALVMIPLAVFCIWALVRDGSEQRLQEQRLMAERTSAGALAGRTPAYGTQQTQAGRAGAQPREPVGAGTSGMYGSDQAGQRWPENVGSREQAGAGRDWQPADVKESGSRLGDKVQEHAQSGARGAQQPGRNPAEEAQDRARQAAGRDYRSGR